MKISSVSIMGFRSYKEKTDIQIEDMTVLVGKNDIGKSTVLEALDIFFNDGKTCGKIEKADINKQMGVEGKDEVIIAVSFSDLPNHIMIDSTVETSLKAEYMLNKKGHLEIVKHYKNAGSPKVYIRAIHPTNPFCADLLIKKNTDLRKIIKDNDIECDNLIINATMRSAIWKHYKDDLQLEEIEIDTSKEDAKEIWTKINDYLPMYTLFQSDRKNTDGDSEVQDPLQTAVRQIMSESGIQEKLSDITKQVQQRLKEVSKRTLEKLQEMDPAVASSLQPVIVSPEKLKWADVFKNVSITGDSDIPINKRGSGVKRLVLLNFFRAEAERKNEDSGNGIIYAIEEPETSQHSANQKILVDALVSLANSERAQVIMTTHSPTVVKRLNYSNLRIILEVSDGQKEIKTIQSGLLGYPSLNEINYVAFNEITEEYHNELYGYIDMHDGWMSEYKNGKKTYSYIQIDPRKHSTTEKQYTQTEIIRHQIHHPENKNNIRFTENQLAESIKLMTEFIQNHNEQIEPDQV